MRAEGRREEEGGVRARGGAVLTPMHSGPKTSGRKTT